MNSSRCPLKNVSLARRDRVRGPADAHPVMTRTLCHTVVAATNKCLAQSNKSSVGDKATNKVKKPRSKLMVKRVVFGAIATTALASFAAQAAPMSRVPVDSATWECNLIQVNPPDRDRDP